MAWAPDRLPENVPGDLFVDATCIDCDTCRQIAPHVFARSRRGLSFVQEQPASDRERRRATMALVACPTGSIGSTSRAGVAQAVLSFPERVKANVYYCGFTSSHSFGAASYLIVSPDGNVLVDSPRANEPLMRKVAELGGVSTMLLTHGDDVADHQRWHERFGCRRVLHEKDLDDRTRLVEERLVGNEERVLRRDLIAIPVPGHTAGSTAFLYNHEFLFTGDHLWWSNSYGRLHASRDVCWHSWPAQLTSLLRLLDYRFSWVLPGHGRRYRAESSALMRLELARAIEVLHPTGGPR